MRKIRFINHYWYDTDKPYILELSVADADSKSIDRYFEVEYRKCWIYDRSDYTIMLNGMVMSRYCKFIPFNDANYHATTRSIVLEKIMTN